MGEGQVGEGLVGEALVGATYQQADRVGELEREVSSLRTALLAESDAVLRVRAHGRVRGPQPRLIAPRIR